MPVRYREIDLGSSAHEGDPVYFHEVDRLGKSSDSFKNKTGLTLPYEQSRGRTILDAELWPEISKRCMIDIYLDANPNLVFGGTVASRTLIEISWGVGGASLSTQFTIREIGHYRISVIGNWFRVSVLNQEIYVSDPLAQLSATISLGETSDDEWGLFVGWINLDQPDNRIPSRSPHCAYIAQGNGYSTGPTGAPTLTNSGGVLYHDIIPKYAREYKILMKSMGQFYLDEFGFAIAPNEFMPWIPINHKFFNVANTPPTIEILETGGLSHPEALVFVRY